MSPSVKTIQELARHWKLKIFFPRGGKLLSTALKTLPGINWGHDFWEESVLSVLASAYCRNFPQKIKDKVRYLCNLSHLISMVFEDGSTASPYRGEKLNVLRKSLIWEFNTVWFQVEK